MNAKKTSSQAEKAYSSAIANNMSETGKSMPAVQFKQDKEEPITEVAQYKNNPITEVTQYKNNPTTAINHSALQNDVAQREIIFEPEGTMAKYLPHFVANWSERSDIFKKAFTDDSITCKIILDDAQKDEKSLNVLGHTRGVIFVENGKNEFYYLDNNGDVSKILKTARENGDYLKMRSMLVYVKVNKYPFMQILSEGKVAKTGNVEQSLPQMNVTFAHEWELHVAPMIELYEWVRLQQQIIDNKKTKSDELEQEKIVPLLNLLEGGEDAEHKDTTNLAYFFTLLENAKDALSEDPKSLAIVNRQLIGEMINLGLEPEEVFNLLDLLHPPKKDSDEKKEEK